MDQEMSAFRYLKLFMYFSFSGRASAKEYTIINLGGITLLLCSYILFGPPGIAALSLYLVLLINAAAVRRSHDIESKNINIFNRSNWGKLYYIESDEGSNKYGPEPWDSKRNLRITQNPKEIEKLLTLNRNSKKRDKELNTVIKRLSIVVRLPPKTGFTNDVNEQAVMESLKRLLNGIESMFKPDAGIKYFNRQ